jgi:hypothetical protein
MRLTLLEYIRHTVAQWFHHATIVFCTTIIVCSKTRFDLFQWTHTLNVEIIWTAFVLYLIAQSTTNIAHKTMCCPWIRFVIYDHSQLYSTKIMLFFVHFTELLANWMHLLHCFILLLHCFIHEYYIKQNNYKPNENHFMQLCNNHRKPLNGLMFCMSSELWWTL